MSRIGEVLKSKNRIEKDRKVRRRTELNNLRSRTAFKARLVEQLKDIDTILEDSSVNSVIIKIRPNLMDKFSESIYSGELSGYVIEQIASSPDKFKVTKKFISL